MVNVWTSWSHLLLLQQSSNNEDFWGTGTSKIEGKWANGGYVTFARVNVSAWAILGEVDRITMW